MGIVSVLLLYNIFGVLTQTFWYYLQPIIVNILSSSSSLFPWKRHESDNRLDLLLNVKVQITICTF